MNDKLNSDGQTQYAKLPAPAETLAAIISALPGLADRHNTADPAYRALALAARTAVVEMFGPNSHGAQDVGPFGTLDLPYHRMGAIDSIDLFGLDELIIFAFYWANRGRYRKVADIGANIGLHSTILFRCGFEVTNYEPDPEHISVMKANFARNNIANVAVVQSAVSDHMGKANFLRLRGNTTGSHLAGAKPNPYGEIDTFEVALAPFVDIASKVDFAKVDAEGHEAVIVTSLPAEQWASLDVMLEIGSVENAVQIFDYCQKSGVNILTQKTGWARAASASDLPTSHRDGSAFITRKPALPGFGQS